MSRRFFTLVGFTLLLAAVMALGVVAEGQAAKPKPPTISVEADKPSYVRGDAGHLTVTLTNPNAEPMLLALTPRAITKATVQLREEGARFKPAPSRTSEDDDDFPDDLNVRIESVPPGSSASFVVPLLVERGDLEAIQAMEEGVASDTIDQTTPRGLMLLLRTTKNFTQQFFLVASGEYSVVLTYKYVGPGSEGLFRGSVKAPAVTFRLR